jgi:hypothetical protein
MEIPPHSRLVTGLCRDKNSGPRSAHQDQSEARSLAPRHRCYHLAEMPRASTPSQQLSRFLAKYSPEIAAQARRILAKMRKRLPGSTEMVYDNYNGLVIGFGPTDKPSLAILSILLMPDHVTLCFLQGASLPDPNRRLKGGGNLVRHVRLVPPSVLDDPEILDLINTALYRAKVSINPKARRQLIIKSISAKQRPRRPIPKRK